LTWFCCRYFLVEWFRIRSIWWKWSCRVYDLFIKSP